MAYALDSARLNRKTAQWQAPHHNIARTTMRDPDHKHHKTLSGPSPHGRQLDRPVFKLKLNISLRVRNLLHDFHSHARQVFALGCSALHRGHGKKVFPQCVQCVKLVTRSSNSLKWELYNYVLSLLHDDSDTFRDNFDLLMLPFCICDPVHQ